MRRSTLAGLAVGAAAFLFGSTFVVIKDAVSSSPPINFVAWRFLIGGLALAILAFPRGRRLWRDAAITGLILFVGYAAQTAGLVTTGASNSALITGLFVIITPIMAALLARRAPGGWVAVGAVTAFMGVVLLTAREGVALNPGDLLTLVCAFAFAAHIVALARFAPRHRVVPFTAAQLLVTAAVSFPVAAVVEGVSTPLGRELPALLLTGLGVSAGAFLLQIWAQTVIGPARTGILLALEPAFGVVTAAIVLGERLTPGGWLGAGLIIAAIYLVVTRGEDERELEIEAISAAH
ncbi:MAG TPA: DMT family transporter [Acidimicrobiia bacterium]|nr:DMT family transporter [Acidimicrobiia bacterium]